MAIPRTLFDRVGTVPPVARARVSDPDTSHEAARRVERSGKAERQRKALLTEVTRRPGQTAGEIAERLGMDRYDASRRLPDLLDDPPRVAKGRKRRCGVLSSTCVTWWPV